MNNSSAQARPDGTKSASGPTEVLMKHSEERLLKAVDDLFRTADFSLITDHLSKLMFYATQPERSKELGKDDKVPGKKEKE